MSAPATLCHIVFSLNVEVARRTGYTPVPGCPQVGFGILTGTGSRSQAGAYLPGADRIELAPDLDLASPVGLSYLLHELVHAAQYHAGRDAQVPCPARLEAEAYQVQAEFLADLGLREEATSFTVMASLLGLCPGEGDYR